MRILSKLLAGFCCFLLLSGCSGGGQAEDLTVIFPKLGCSDAALLLTDTATVVIDTGENHDGDEILELLEEYGRSTVDLLLISHYDKDHVGGAAELLENCTVKRVIGSTSPKDSAEMDAYRNALKTTGLTEEVPTEAVSITLENLKLTVDPPRQAAYSQDQSNNSSTVVTVDYQNTRLLFAGDAMDARTAEFTSMLEKHSFDLIKIPHHGRDTSTTEQLLPALKDNAAAIITSSRKEPENQAVLDRLNDSGIDTYLTRKGTLTVTSDGNSLTILQES